jgi:hypothetical protein
MFKLIFAWAVLVPSAFAGSYDMLPGMTITHNGLVTNASGSKKVRIVQTITKRDAEKIFRHLKMFNVAADGSTTLTQEYDDAYTLENFWTQTRIDAFLKTCQDEGRMNWIKVEGKRYRGCPHTESYGNGSSLLEWVGRVPFGNLHSEFKSKDSSVQIYDYAGTLFPTN